MEMEEIAMFYLMAQVFVKILICGDLDVSQDGIYV
jgi:hypothetical protein